MSLTRTPPPETDTPKAPASRTIGGLTWPLVAVLCLALALGVYFDSLPMDTFLIGFVAASLIGFVLSWIGGLTRLLRTLGAPTLLIVLVPAALNYMGLIPESVGGMMESFFSGYNMLDVFVASLMVGSILGIDSQLLKKSLIRFVIPLLTAVTAGVIVAGLLAEAFGLGFLDGLFKIGFSISGSGTGSGVIPMAQMFEEASGDPASSFLAVMIPVAVYANILAVLIATLYNVIANSKVRILQNLSGNGSMVRGHEITSVKDGAAKNPVTLEKLFVGIMLTGAIYVTSIVISDVLVPVVHYFGWICILTVILKLSGRCPKYLEEGATCWYDFVVKYLTPAILVAVSLAVIDFGQMLEVITQPAYLIIITVTVLVVAIASGTIGYLMGLNFIESSIASGLCTVDMGGGGDVIVLSASDRMNLMPYAALSTRIGGGLVLISASLLSAALM